MNESPREDVWAAGDLYEPYVGRWSRRVAREFLDWLAVPEEKDWLDVGCGTGALTQIILDHASPKRVRSVDASPGYIEYAKAHVTAGPASFEVGDAQSLPVDTASVDAAVSDLMLNFVPQAERAVAEMSRATRPDGVVAAYVWDYAGKMELMRYFWDAAVELDSAASELTRVVDSRSASPSLSPSFSPRRGCSMSRRGRLMFHCGRRRDSADCARVGGPRTQTMMQPRPARTRVFAARSG
ncbi:MAG: class I SAM-dependent methyltransferase [Woeseia sp.]